MRADRLISLIMILESKGPQTAEELTDQLEVSPRTIYRDIESLSISGVPVYGTPGPEGGYQLMDGYRSYLDSLTKEELQALLSLNIVEQVDQLEIGSRLKTAILKIRSSYTHLTSQEDGPVERLYVDPVGWDSMGSHKFGKDPSQINILYRAVHGSQRLQITYNNPGVAVDNISKIVDPYGLVAKENRWYLVYNTRGKICVIGLSRIFAVERLNQTFTYPADFNLKQFWKDWCNQLVEQFSSFEVRLLVPLQLKTHIANLVKKGKVPIFPYTIDFTDPKWSEVILYFESFEEARNKLLIFGGAVKVIEPIALKYSLIDYAEQVLNAYKSN